MLRNVLRPIGGTNQVISQLTSRVALGPYTMRRFLSMSTGVQLLNYPMTREGENTHVWEAKLYVRRKKEHRSKGEERSW